jgi:tetratricopeptide (TPR) repeat protein
VRQSRAASAVYQGIALAKQNQLDEAAKCFRHALELDPKCYDALNNLGIVLKRLEQWPEALTAFQSAISLRPEGAEAHYNMGNCLRAMGDLRGAADAFCAAVRHQRGYYAAYNNLAITLLDLGRVDESIAACRRAIEIDPSIPSGWENLGLGLDRAGQPEDAIKALREAIRLDPNFTSAHTHLGVVLLEIGRLAESLECQLRAVELDPTNARFHNRLGNVLAAGGRFDEALEAYRKAIAYDQSSIEAHVNLGIYLMLVGRFDEGLHEYEWRLKMDNSGAARFATPLWDGKPFPGRTLLIWAEQGYGDAIQMARFIPRARALGGTVVVECREPLRRLFEPLSGVGSVVLLGNELPPHDFHLPMMSLMRVFRESRPPISNDIPYISAPKDAQDRLVHAFRQGRQMRAGIVWKGSITNQNDRNRSIPFEEIRALLSQSKNISFYSLQVESDVASASLEALRVVDLSPYLADFADTAGAMTHLDLVISVDTAAAHLAGAVGKPVWVMLPYSPDWRWMLNREDSPWYPTMRLFRQKSPEDWGGVIEKIVVALRDFADSHGHRRQN